MDTDVKEVFSTIVNNAFCARSDSILEEEEPEELTTEEIELIVKQSNIFTCFFRNPTLENYQAIRSNDVLYRKALGKKYTVFLMGVRGTFEDLQDPLTEIEDLDYELEVDRLVDLRNALSTNDLDVLWALYYATGDVQFPNRIKAVMNNGLQHTLIRGAASWSYDSHVRQGLLQDPEWGVSKTSAGFNEVIQFAMNQQGEQPIIIPMEQPSSANGECTASQLVEK